MTPSDKKMFAPLRHREAMSPESKLCVILGGYVSGAIPSALAESLVLGGLAVGTRSLVTKRVGEILDHLEQEGKVERTPDGRYRAVRVVRATR
jgi:hypothetical protein